MVMGDIEMSEATVETSNAENEESGISDLALKPMSEIVNTEFVPVYLIWVLQVEIDEYYASSFSSDVDLLNITSKDIDSLRSGKWIRSEVMNVLGKNIFDASGLDKIDKPKFGFLDSYQLKCFDFTQHIADLYFCIENLRGVHWRLLVVFQKLGIVYVIDSLPNTSVLTDLELGRPPISVPALLVDSLQQTNGDDCGIFVLENLKRLSRYLADCHTKIFEVSPRDLTNVLCAQKINSMELRNLLYLETKRLHQVALLEIIKRRADQGSNYLKTAFKNIHAGFEAILQVAFGLRQLHEHYDEQHVLEPEFCVMYALELVFESCAKENPGNSGKEIVLFKPSSITEAQYTEQLNYIRSLIQLPLLEFPTFVRPTSEDLAYLFKLRALLDGQLQVSELSDRNLYSWIALKNQTVIRYVKQRKSQGRKNSHDSQKKMASSTSTIETALPQSEYQQLDIRSSTVSTTSTKMNTSLETIQQMNFVDPERLSDNQSLPLICPNTENNMVFGLELQESQMQPVVEHEHLDILPKALKQETGVEFVLPTVMDRQNGNHSDSLIVQDILESGNERHLSEKDFVKKLKKDGTVVSESNNLATTALSINSECSESKEVMVPDHDKDGENSVQVSVSTKRKPAFRYREHPIRLKKRKKSDKRSDQTREHDSEMTEDLCLETVLQSQVDHCCFFCNGSVAPGTRFSKVLFYSDSLEPDSHVFLCGNCSEQIFNKNMKSPSFDDSSIIKRLCTSLKSTISDYEHFQTTHIQEIIQWSMDSAVQGEPKDFNTLQFLFSLILVEMPYPFGSNSFLLSILKEKSKMVFESLTWPVVKRGTSSCVKDPAQEEFECYSNGSRVRQHSCRFSDWMKNCLPNVTRKYGRRQQANHILPLSTLTEDLQFTSIDELMLHLDVELVACGLSHTGHPDVFFLTIGLIQILFHPTSIKSVPGKRSISAHSEYSLLYQRICYLYTHVVCVITCYGENGKFLSEPEVNQLETWGFPKIMTIFETLESLRIFEDNFESMLELLFCECLLEVNDSSLDVDIANYIGKLCRYCQKQQTEVDESLDEDEEPFDENVAFHSSFLILFRLFHVLSTSEKQVPLKSLLDHWRPVLFLIPIDLFNDVFNMEKTLSRVTSIFLNEKENVDALPVQESDRDLISAVLAKIQDFLEGKSFCGKVQPIEGEAFWRRKLKQADPTRWHTDGNEYVDMAKKEKNINNPRVSGEFYVAWVKLSSRKEEFTTDFAIVHPLIRIPTGTIVVFRSDIPHGSIENMKEDRFSLDIRFRIEENKSK